MQRDNQLEKRPSVKYQNWFLRTNRLRRWVLIVGEGVAVISGCAYFIPGLPEFINDITIPIAVLSGALALLLVAVYDKLDPTVLHVCVLTMDAYDLLRESGQLQQDTIYMTSEGAYHSTTIQRDE